MSPTQKTVNQRHTIKKENVNNPIHIYVEDINIHLVIMYIINCPLLLLVVPLGTATLACRVDIVAVDFAVEQIADA